MTEHINIYETNEDYNWVKAERQLLAQRIEATMTEMQVYSVENLVEAVRMIVQSQVKASKDDMRTDALKSVHNRLGKVFGQSLPDLGPVQDLINSVWTFGHDGCGHGDDEGDTKAGAARHCLRCQAVEAENALDAYVKAVTE